MRIDSFLVNENVSIFRHTAAAMLRRCFVAIHNGPPRSLAAVDGFTCVGLSCTDSVVYVGTGAHDVKVFVHFHRLCAGCGTALPIW